MKNIFQDLKRKDHKRYLGGLDVFKYIGPGHSMSHYKAVQTGYRYLNKP